LPSIVSEVVLVNPPDLTTVEGGRAETTGQAYTLSVPSLASEYLTVTAPDGSKFTWQPSMLLYQDEFGIPDYLLDSMPSSLTVLGRQARYLRSFANADDVFHAQPNRVKHWTVLNEPPRDAAVYLSSDSLLFGISGIVSGTKLPIGIFDSITAGVFQLPQPSITDLSGQIVTGFYEVIDIDDETQQLNIWMDATILKTMVYPIMIDPTVVVASVYATCNTARPQILSNGWIVQTVSSSTTIYFYVSKDNGATYQLLQSLTPTYPMTAGFAVCSYGTRIYLFGANVNNSGSLGNQLYTFDATNVSGGTSSNPIGSISNNTNYISVGLSIGINSTGTAITVALSAMGSNYNTAGYNILSARSIDGGLTWKGQAGSAGTLSDQVTSGNAASADPFILPYVMYNKNDIACIFFTMSESGYNEVLAMTWSTSSNQFLAAAIFTNSVTTYSQRCPVGITKKYGANIGRIYCAWHGKDSTYPSYYGILVSYSDDIGVTWATPLHITSGNTVVRQNVSLSEKPNGDIIAMYEDNGVVSYQVCPNGSTTFAGLTVIGTGTCPAISDSLNAISTYVWGTTTNVQADKFSFNNAPNAPALTAKSNCDATVAQIFNWVFSDPDAGDSQTAYELICTRVSDGAVMKDTAQVSSTASTYSLPANTLANGIQYQWKVRAWDTSNVAGTYSSLGTFTTALAPTVVISSPATDGIVLATNGVVAGFTFHSNTLTQGSYQVRLTDNNDNQLWSSGQLSGTNNLLTIPYSLLNLTSYKLKITVWDTYGLQSIEVVRLFSTSFTPPAVPVLSHVDDNIKGQITLSISNPVPTGSQPAVDHNDIYRMASNETIWTRVATGIPNNGSYTDYSPQSGMNYQYQAIAIGVNSSSTVSNIITSSITVLYVQITSTQDHTKYVALRYYEPKVETVTKTKASMLFAGREYSVSEFGEHTGRTIPFTFHINNVNDLNMIRALVDSEQILLYRDNRGRKMFCTIDALGVTDQNPNYYDVTINPEQVSYTEVV